MRTNKQKNQQKLTSYRAIELQRGIATLPTVLALMLLMVAVAVGITSLAFSESVISSGAALSSQALVYAEAGARDALERVARDKTYLCATSSCYSIDFVQSTGCSNNDGCGRIQVTGNDTSKTITSEGRAKNNIRTIQVTVTLDANGEITATAWQELIT